MLYRCSSCGAVYYLLTPFPAAHCDSSGWIVVKITAQANEYSEASGEVTGIHVTVSVD